MFSHRIAGLRLQRRLLFPKIVLVHSKTWHASRPSVSNSCSSNSDGASISSVTKLPDIERAEKSGPVRFGFIPENWFVFFYPHTGVSGPYIFGFVLINYWLSKEIYVMEHEYYLGLSIAVVTYYVTTRMGPDIGKSFDSEIEKIEAELQKTRLDQKDYYKSAINEAQAAQKRANGQKLLMDAKKENISMQLEAVYRERKMHVYQTTKGRMDYQIKRLRTENKIHQKWMLQWILENVRNAITPEFEQQALDAAIRDLTAAAEEM